MLGLFIRRRALARSVFSKNDHLFLIRNHYYLSNGSNRITTAIYLSIRI